MVSYTLTRDLSMEPRRGGTESKALLLQGPSLHSLLPHPAPAPTALLAQGPSSRTSATMGPECLLLSEF